MSTIFPISYIPYSPTSYTPYMPPSPDERQSKALLRAAQEGQPCILQELIESGADVNACDRSNKTALHFAAKRGDAACISVLLEADADVNACDDFKETALHLAVRSRNSECVSLLLRAGAAVNACDYFGLTALHMTAMNLNSDCASVLLEAGADVHARTADGSTALHMTAMIKNSNCASVFIRAGADVNARTADGSTALHMAARSKNPNCVYDLLRAGADVNAQNLMRSIPLQEAVSGYADTPRYKKCIAALLEAGADVHKKGTRNQSFFKWTIQHLKFDYLKKMLLRTENLGLIEGRYNFLHELSFRVDDLEPIIEILEFLGEHYPFNPIAGLRKRSLGLVPKVSISKELILLKVLCERDRDGDTPLHILCRRREYDSAEWERLHQTLVRLGVKGAWNATDKNGETPKDILTRKGLAPPSLLAYDIETP